MKSKKKCSHCSHFWHSATVKLNKVNSAMPKTCLLTWIKLITDGQQSRHPRFSRAGSERAQGLYSQQLFHRHLAHDLRQDKRNDPQPATLPTGRCYSRRNCKAQSHAIQTSFIWDESGYLRSAARLYLCSHHCRCQTSYASVTDTAIIAYPLKTETINKRHHQCANALPHRPNNKQTRRQHPSLSIKQSRPAKSPSPYSH